MNKDQLRLNLNKIQADNTSLEVNQGANSSIENTSAGLNETFLNSKRLNNTTYGDASLLQNLDNSLFSDIGTARSLNSQRNTNRSKSNKKRKDEVSKFDEIMSQG